MWSIDQISSGASFDFAQDNFYVSFESPSFWRFNYYPNQPNDELYNESQPSSGTFSIVFYDGDEIEVSFDVTFPEGFNLSGSISIPQIHEWTECIDC